MTSKGGNKGFAVMVQSMGFEVIFCKNWICGCLHPNETCPFS